MKKLISAASVCIVLIAASVSEARIETLQDLVCNSSYILVVERLDPPVTTHGYNCWVGTFHNRAYHETIHHFRVREVLRGALDPPAGKNGELRIDVHKAYTHTWWSLQKNPPKIHGDLIEERYSRGRKTTDAKTLIVFLGKPDGRFEYVIHDAFEPVEKRAEIVKLIAKGYKDCRDE